MGGKAHFRAGDAVAPPFNLVAALALVSLPTASPASAISALTVRTPQAAGRQRILSPVVKDPDGSLTD